MPIRGPRLRLFGRMLSYIGLTTFLPLVAVLSIATSRTYRIVQDDSYRYAATLGSHYADLIGQEIRFRLGQLEAMASVFETYGLLPPEDRRNIVSTALHSVLAVSPDLRAVWALWEPGAIGDSGERDSPGIQGDPNIAQDGLYSGDEDSAAKDPSRRGLRGTYYVCWYWRGGEIAKAGIASGGWRSNFYKPAKERMAPVLINPYYYTYTGKPEGKDLETTISVPIVVDGAFKGVVGFDLSTNFYGTLLADFKIFETGYGVLAGSDGRIIWHPDPSKIGLITGTSDGPEAEKYYLGKFAEGRAFSADRISALTGKKSRIFFFPVDCGISSMHWFFSAVVPLSEIREAADRLAYVLWGTGSLVLIALGLAIFATARRLTLPISALSASAQRIALGDFSSRVEAKGYDEVADLANSFNTMGSRLEATLLQHEDANRELTAMNIELSEAKEGLIALNAELETKVAERTKELSESNRNLSAMNAELSAAMERLKLAQEQAITAEKFAVIGRLSANVAHEINTPLGAISSSADRLLDIMAGLIKTLPDFLIALRPEERDFFYLLLPGRDDSAADFMRAYDRATMRSLSARFAEAGFENPELVADDIRSLDLDDVEAAVATTIALRRPDIVEMAAMVSSLRLSGYIIRNAVDMASRTVMALSEYSRHGESEEPSLFYPIREIENLLVLYHNYIKRGVEIVRNFNCTEPVFGSRERISHVWANIINNALQAMEYKGTLEIGTRLDGEWIIVSFTDSGPGIPESNKASIFEPFFTTKLPGEGTGLGLNICKNIVEQHGGRISFESGPGRTTFMVAFKVYSQSVKKEEPK